MFTSKMSSMSVSSNWKSMDFLPYIFLAKDHAGAIRNSDDPAKLLSLVKQSSTFLSHERLLAKFNRRVRKPLKCIVSMKLTQNFTCNVGTDEHG